MKHIAKRGEYKYIWLLDNDAEIEKNTLQELITVMEGDEQIGICGSALFDYHNKNFLG